MSDNPYQTSETEEKSPRWGVDIEHLIGYNSKGTDWFLAGAVFVTVIVWTIIFAVF